MAVEKGDRIWPVCLKPPQHLQQMLRGTLMQVRGTCPRLWPLFFFRRRLCYKMAITSRAVGSVPQTVRTPSTPLIAPSFAS